MKGFVLGGTSSGVGKTIAALATLRALENAGYDSQPAKAGPDFIDPSHHTQVTGRPSHTLDTWLQGEDGLCRNYHRGEGDICVVEGVMGLYDGDGSSTAMVAEALSLPVVLVVDASAGMESVAATALGFQRYANHAGRDIDVVGILAQRAHGGRHERGIREALPEGLDYFGRIGPDDALEIPDRHLGLELGEEFPLDPAALDRAAEHVDSERLVAAARTPPEPPERSPKRNDRPRTGKRVALARDRAFRFCYPATIERLGERSELIPFAPTAGEELPDCDGVYLPGGYPELHAEALAGSPALEAIAERAPRGLPVFGECGGMMALAESLRTADGECHEMAGVLPADVRMEDRYQALDHVELEASSETLTASAGGRLRGHEFHYSGAEVASDARFAFDVLRGTGIEDGREGLIEHQVLGTYCHVHPASGAFDAFVEAIGNG
jgi:cobyrinic acid a,c-diamide synthase